MREAVLFKNTMIVVRAGKSRGNLPQEKALPDLPLSLSPHHHWAK